LTAPSHHARHRSVLWKNVNAIVFLSTTFEKSHAIKSKHLEFIDLVVLKDFGQICPPLPHSKLSLPGYAVSTPHQGADLIITDMFIGTPYSLYFAQSTLGPNASFVVSHNRSP